MSERLAEGLAHHQAGRLEDAKVAYQALLASDPESVDGWHLLGVVAIQQGEIASAVERISRAIDLRNDVPEIHNNLGNALRMVGRDAEALESFRHACELRPDFFEALNNQGSALRALGRTGEARAVLEAALALRPDSSDTIMNLGNVFKAERRFDEAIAAFDRALERSPNLAEAWSNRAATLIELSRPDEALDSIARALKIEGHDPEFWTNLGKALTDLEQFDGAKNAFEQALALRPDYVLALCNLGVVLVHLKAFDQAIELYERALKIEPESHLAKFGLSLVLLRRGQYERAWPLYESRWNMVDFVGRYPYRERPGLWDGRESLSGRRLLVWAEQGLGDTIQFARFVPKLAELGAHVEMHVPKPLGALMSGLVGVRRVITQPDPIFGTDLHVPIMSLPSIFGTKLRELPTAKEPYLFADRYNCSVWSQRLGAKRSSRIGVMWRGGAMAKLRNRSIDLQQFSFILDRSLEFVSLAKDLTEQDAAALRALPELRHFGDLQKSLDDAASLIINMDLVITVDTSIAHLSGSLGKPTWVLLHHDADWRWLESTDRSPWYDTVKLYRQPAPNDWASVLRTIKRDLLAISGQIVVGAR